jgi:hypothetical protein
MHRLTRATLIDIAIAIGVLAAFVLLLMMGAGCGDFGSLSMVRTSYRPLANAAEVTALSAQCLAMDRSHFALVVTSGVTSAVGGSSSLIALAPTPTDKIVAISVAATFGFVGLGTALGAAHEAALFVADGCGSTVP